MNFDMSKFKKVGEDKSTATLKHERGHKITIAKNALSEKMRAQLSKLPMNMDEGGAVPEEQKQNPNQPTIIINNGPQPQQQMPAPIPEQDLNPTDSAFQNSQMKRATEGAQTPGVIGNLPAPQEEQPVLQAPPPAPPAPPVAQPQPMVQPPPAAPQDPYGNQAYIDSYMGGLNQQKAGIGLTAQGEMQKGRESAALLKSNIDERQQRMKSFDDHYTELDQERLAARKELPMINGGRFLDSMSTGKRISTAIGLILGGIGGGLTHTGNDNLEFLNKQIANDIEAQKENLGRGKTLLDANLKQFGNLKDATDMTRVMLSDQVSDGLKLAGEKAQDPLAKGRALQAAGALDVTAAPILSQLAMRKTLMGQMQGGSLSQNPAAAIRMIVPEGEKAAAFKALDESHELQKFADSSLSAFDQLNQLNTVGNRVTSPIQTSRQVNGILKPIVAMMGKELAGRFTETDAEYFKSQFPQVGDDEKTIRTKRTNMNRILQQKMVNPGVLEQYGINPYGKGKYSAQGDKTIKLGPPVQ